MALGRRRKTWNGVIRSDLMERTEVKKEMLDERKRYYNECDDMID